MCIRRCCVRIYKVPLCCVYKAAFCLNKKCVNAYIRRRCLFICMYAYTHKAMCCV